MRSRSDSVHGAFRAEVVLGESTAACPNPDWATQPPGSRPPEDPVPSREIGAVACPGTRHGRHRRTPATYLLEFEVGFEVVVRSEFEAYIRSAGECPVKL